MLLRLIPSIVAILRRNRVWTVRITNKLFVASDSGRVIHHDFNELFRPSWSIPRGRGCSLRRQLFQSALVFHCCSIISRPLPGLCICSPSGLRKRGDWGWPARRGPLRGRSAARRHGLRLFHSLIVTVRHVEAGGEGRGPVGRWLAFIRGGSDIVTRIGRQPWSCPSVITSAAAVGGGCSRGGGVIPLLPGSKAKTLVLP